MQAFERFLVRWRGAGLLDEATEGAIRQYEEAQAKPSGRRWQVILALVMGGILLGAGVRAERSSRLHGEHALLISYVHLLRGAVGVDDRPDPDDPSQHHYPQKERPKQHKEAAPDAPAIHLAGAAKNQRQCECKTWRFRPERRSVIHENNGRRRNCVCHLHDGGARRRRNRRRCSKYPSKPGVFNCPGPDFRSDQHDLSCAVDSSLFDEIRELMPRIGTVCLAFQIYVPFVVERVRRRRRRWRRRHANSFWRRFAGSW